MAGTRSRLASVAQLAAEEGAAGHVKIGWVCELQEDRLLVDFPGNTAGPLAARTTVEIPARPPGERCEVVLVFEEGDLARPVVLGVLRSPTSEGPWAQPPIVAEADGRRLVLEGKDEVVLRCGDASITLRRNGRVVIRGAEVESRASGTNKVRGGSVRIN